MMADATLLRELNNADIVAMPVDRLALLVPAGVLTIKPWNW